MRTPIFVRPLSTDERDHLAAALRSSDAFTLRRAQAVLASARGERAPQIARALGCDDQTVRDAIVAFNARGLAALHRGSCVPHTLPHKVITTAQVARLRALLHHSPRAFGHATSLWTLALAAEEAARQGITPRRVTGETIRAVLAQHGVRWLRAKRWITSPDPAYARKKARRDRLIRLATAHPDWLLGFEDEVWWSRLARPAVHAWQDDAHPMRLVERAVVPADPDPKALACYGLLARSWDERQHRTEALWLHFVDGRPVSAVTVNFLRWCAEQAHALGKRPVLLVWDNAPWHESQIVRTWLRQHNRQVKRTGQGVRLVVCFLPVKSPWLNPIEPKWLVGKRRMAEPERLLTAPEVVDRVCAAYACPHHPHLVAPPPAKRKQSASKKAA